MLWQHESTTKQGGTPRYYFSSPKDNNAWCNNSRFGSVSEVNEPPVHITFIAWRCLPLGFEIENELVRKFPTARFASVCNAPPGLDRKKGILLKSVECDFSYLFLFPAAWTVRQSSGKFKRRRLVLSSDNRSRKCRSQRRSGYISHIRAEPHDSTRRV